MAYVYKIERAREREYMRWNGFVVKMAMPCRLINHAIVSDSFPFRFLTTFPNDVDNFPKRIGTFFLSQLDRARHHIPETNYFSVWCHTAWKQVALQCDGIAIYNLFHLSNWNQVEAHTRGVSHKTIWNSIFFHSIITLIPFVISFPVFVLVWKGKKNQWICIFSVSSFSLSFLFSFFLLLKRKASFDIWREECFVEKISEKKQWQTHIHTHHSPIAHTLHTYIHKIYKASGCKKIITKQFNYSYCIHTRYMV